jgi:CheY-like chemotaxis protein
MRYILYTDDDESQLRTIKISFEALYSNEFEVFTANNGNECLKILKEGLIPDVILLDMMMPEMSGIEIIENIKDNPEWKNIPIILLTGISEEKIKEIGETLADDFFEKPIEIERLKIMIEKVINKKTILH